MRMGKLRKLKNGGVISTLLFLASVSANVRGQKTYQRVTSPSHLEAEKSYLIIGANTNGEYFALSTEQKLNNRGAVEVTLTGDRITLEQESTACQLVLKGTSSSGWAFYDEGNGGYLYAASNSNNYLKTEKTLDNNGRADITFAGDTASITFKGSNKCNVLQYNGISVLFACYASASQQPVQLFKKVEAKDNQVSLPVLSPASGTIFADSLTVTAACSTEGATIHYTNDGIVPTAESATLPAEGLKLTETVTLKAIAVKDGMENSEVAEATYTKVEPYASLKELKDSGVATESGIECFVKLTDAAVTFADTLKAYIQDATGGLEINGKNSLKTGTKLNGVASGKLKLYNGLFELTVEAGSFDGVTATDSAEIPVQTVTLAELNQDLAKYESMRVKVTEATVTSIFKNQNAIIEQEGQTITLRAADDSIAVDAEATVDVTGYPGMYNTSKQLNVMSQGDIVVTKEGKKQATLTFGQETYIVNIGESVTVKAITNSTDTVAYSADGTELATVDGSTGEVVAGEKEGSLTVTATVEANDKFTGATATCTVKIVNPDKMPDIVAFVATTKDGKHHVMSSEKSGSHLKARWAATFKGQVVTERMDICGWIADQETGTIRNFASNQYLNYSGSSTDLELSTSNLTTWTCTADGEWKTENRTIALGEGSNGFYFGAYTSTGIETPAAHTMPIVDGYHREMSSGHYGTICLPCAVNAGDMGGAEFYSIAGKEVVDGKPQSVILNPVETLEAGKPYIFYTSADTVIAIYSGEAVGTPGEENGLIGSFAGQDVEGENLYVISKDDKVQLCGTGCKIAENRAYIDMEKVPEYSTTTGVNVRSISIGGTTGIPATTADGGTVDVYTIGGVEVRRKVDVSEATKGLPRGVYIVNGKKIVVK